VIEAGRAAGAQVVFTRDVHPSEQFAETIERSAIGFGT